MMENKIIYNVWQRNENGFEEYDINSNFDDVAGDMNYDLSYFLYREEKRGKNLKEYTVKTIFNDNGYNLINERADKEIKQYEGLEEIKVYNEYKTLVFNAQIK